MIQIPYLNDSLWWKPYLFLMVSGLPAKKKMGQQIQAHQLLPGGSLGRPAEKVIDLIKNPSLGRTWEDERSFLERVMFRWTKKIWRKDVHFNSAHAKNMSPNIGDFPSSGCFQGVSRQGFQPMGPEKSPQKSPRWISSWRKSKTSSMPRRKKTVIRLVIGETAT